MASASRSRRTTGVRDARKSRLPCGRTVYGCSVPTVGRDVVFMQSCEARPRFWGFERGLNAQVLRRGGFRSRPPDFDGVSQVPPALLVWVAVLFVIFQTPSTRIRLCRSTHVFAGSSTSSKPSSTFATSPA